MTRPIRIGLIAEGQTELGTSVSNLDPAMGGKPIARAEEGALHTLIRRELKAAGLGPCVFIRRRPSFRERKNRERITGHGILSKQYVEQVALVWQPSEVDLIIIVADADEEQPQRERDLSRAVAKIVPLLACTGHLAIKNFDTWLLADVKTVSTYLNVSLRGDLPNNFESLPGFKDDTNNAKVILDATIRSSPHYTARRWKRRQVEAKWELAHHIDLAKIKIRCPIGYASFAVALEDHVQQFRSSS